MGLHLPCGFSLSPGILVEKYEGIEDSGPHFEVLGSLERKVHTGVDPED